MSLTENTKTETPLISIVLPTYNGEQYLAESIQSVLDQTYQNWELIIVDDCSTDSTPDIIQSFVNRDSRIRSIRNNPNKKLPASLNIGFADAKGEYFTWTSDDNMYRPHALERLLNAILSEPKADLVYSDYTIINEQGEPTGYRRAPGIERMACENVVGASFLYHRNMHTDLNGYDEGMFCVEDYDFWLRSMKYHTFKVVNDDLYLYRFHDKSLTSTRQKRIEYFTNLTLEKNINNFDYISNDDRWGLHVRLALWNIENSNYDKSVEIMKMIIPEDEALARVARWVMNKGDTKGAYKYIKISFPRSIPWLIKNDKYMISFMIFGEKNSKKIKKALNVIRGTWKRHPNINNKVS